jgi:hypothetical protein
VDNFNGIANEDDVFRCVLLDTDLIFSDLSADTENSPIDDGIPSLKISPVFLLYNWIPTVKLDEFLTSNKLLLSSF